MVCIIAYYFTLISEKRKRNMVHIIIRELIFCWFISKTDVGAFKCNSGRVIDNYYFCNGNSECDDGSDESYGCNRARCSSGYFHCLSSDSCLYAGSRCNGVTECGDGTDEINCGNKVKDEDCTLFNGKYLCHDKLACLDYKYTCDGRCQCMDCSDEDSANCSKSLDYASCSSCPNFCWQTPQGPQCACNSSNHEDSVFCKEMKDCSDEFYCDQYCSRYKEKTLCLCDGDHSPVPHTNNKACRNKRWYENLLIYSTRNKIKALNMTTKRLRVIHNEANITALTAAQNYIYYTSFRNDKSYLYKTPLNAGKAEKLIESDLNIISIAVDWITQNMYYTTNASIFVCAKDGRLCKQLECCAVEYIALAPALGWMYYTQRTNIQDLIEIMRSNMDGSEKNVFVELHYHQPVSLAIDDMRKALYWLEVEQRKLYSITLHGDGSDIKTSILQYGFSPSFTAFDAELFFREDFNNVIYSTRNMENFDRFVDKITNSINCLYAYNPVLQQENKVENPCKSASCNGLCLLCWSSSNNGLNYTCMSGNSTSNNNDNYTCYNSSTLSLNAEPATKNKSDSETTPFHESSTKNVTKTTTEYFTPSTTQQIKTNTMLSSTLKTEIQKSTQNATSMMLSSSENGPCPNRNGTLSFVLGGGFVIGVCGFVIGIYILYSNFKKVHGSIRNRTQSSTITEQMEL